MKIISTVTTVIDFFIKKITGHTDREFFYNSNDLPMFGLNKIHYESIAFLRNFLYMIKISATGLYHRMRTIAAITAAVFWQQN